MPLFRFHRGSLEDSLKTTIVVNSIEDLLNKIIHLELVSWRNVDFKKDITSYEIHIEGKKTFDSRIGWYSHKVDIRFDDTLWVVGYLSEPLNSYYLRVKANDLNFR